MNYDDLFKAITLLIAFPCDDMILWGYQIHNKKARCFQFHAVVQFLGNIAFNEEIIIRFYLQISGAYPGGRLEARAST